MSAKRPQAVRTHSDLRSAETSFRVRIRLAGAVGHESSIRTIAAAVTQARQLADATYLQNLSWEATRQHSTIARRHARLSRGAATQFSDRS